MITKEKWGLVDGQEVYRYTIANTLGTKLVMSDFGATMLNLFVKDKTGKETDVILGYESLESYFQNGEYIGCIVAPTANRICKGYCRIDGVEYHLDINNGANNLHTHHELAANKKIMKTEIGSNWLEFSTFFEDMRANLPGNRQFKVRFTLDDENSVRIDYTMISDKKTLFNPTEHTYFNLNGHDSGTVFKHQLQIHADAFTPVDATSIPTGEIRPVENTVFDFRAFKEIGKDFSLEDQQLDLTLGYDHNYVLNDYNGKIREFARLKGDRSGIEMVCYTDLPGVQFYSSNYLTRKDGKEGADYVPHDGVCLETQYYPDNINHPDFPCSVIEANTEVSYHTIFRFI